MGSDWKHHTSVKPNNRRFDDDSNNEYKQEFDKAFNIFLNECVIDTKEIMEEIYRSGYYRLVINTDNEQDIIIKNTTYHVRFLKSKFLLNKKLKLNLIEYYNPIGFFIKGPVQTSPTLWEFEISKKLQLN